MAKYIELKENLLGNDRQLDALSDDVLSKLESINKLLEKLRDYCSRIGTPRDSKTFRKDLKDKLFNTTLELKEATEILNRMENIEVNPNNEEQKRKKIRRLRDACNKELKEATDLMKNIEKLEKKFVQNARISMQNQEGGESFDQGNNSQSVSKQWAQMDIDEEIIRERENDIVELTKLLAEMNAMAKLQAKYIQEQGEDLEIVYDNIQEVKENTKKAEKELIDANYYKNQLVKSDTKCLIIAVIVCVVFIVLFLFSSSPESADDTPVPTTDESIIVEKGWAKVLNNFRAF